jgi:hypothetical protein
LSALPPVVVSGLPKIDAVLVPELVQDEDQRRPSGSATAVSFRSA